ncbi:MAG TPA: alpha/beta hydrolase [Methylomirabilota bacterium]
MIDIGSGPPLVLVPGIQGRWEWMRPLVEALAVHFRVLSFTLAGERSSRQPIDPRLGFDSFIVQIDRLLEEAGVGSATICGVSYGGLIATRYAAMRPERTRQLVLVSALPPDYQADRRYRFYRPAPLLLFPVFCLDSVHRVWPELRAAFPRLPDRLRFAVAQVLRVASAPASPRRMRERMELIPTVDFRRDAAHVRAETLVVTGSPGLDRTVPSDLSARYLCHLPHATHVLLDRAGHLGPVTRPAALADLIARFVGLTEDAARQGGRRVG